MISTFLINCVWFLLGMVAGMCVLTLICLCCTGDKKEEDTQYTDSCHNCFGASNNDCGNCPNPKNEE